MIFLDCPVKERFEESNGKKQQTPVASGAAGGLVGLAGNLLRENPAVVAPAMIEIGQLVGATAAGILAAKYIYDRTPEVRKNPKSDPDRRSMWPTLTAGGIAFLATDYGLRREESIVVSIAQWIADGISPSEKAQAAQSASEPSPETTAETNGDVPDAASDGMPMGFPDLDLSNLQSPTVATA